MKTMTVYLHKTTTDFCITLGDSRVSDAKNYTIHVYQGSTTLEAALCAYETETRDDVKTQIARFITPEQQVFQVGDEVAPVQPDANFSEPTVIVDVRPQTHGFQYAVINGAPNNVSRRWYNRADLRTVQV